MELRPERLALALGYNTEVVDGSVAVVGVGHAGFAPRFAGVSYKELMHEAARRAYAEAGIDPRRDVDSFVCVSEDLEEGTSIFDEYVPDQLGAVRRPVQTVTADGLHGVATAVMLIRSGVARVVAVEGHRKASDVRTPGRVERFALDPIWNRPLEVPVAALAGLDMLRYLERSGETEERCALVAARHRRTALANPRAAYAADLTPEEVRGSPPISWPLRSLDVASPADGAVVVVLAARERALDLTDRPVWVAGVGWCNGSSSLETRDWGRATAVARAAAMAYRQAGIEEPAASVDVVELDDAFSYRALLHLEALGLAPEGQAGGMLEAGRFDRDGTSRVNPSGGALGEGHLGEGAGLARLSACVAQLRGEAGRSQVPGARVAVAQSWRGFPSDSAAVAVLRAEEAG
ncbi:MAG TPA: acetyl-CoA acetyltransferase [Actinomycetota bacterium]|nr:acetyl-CoA acetyltransferase [Actinomycetota bacterium]